MSAKLRYGGAGLLDLEDPASVAITPNGWTPQTAMLRTGWMGNRGAYEDIDEQLVVNIFGGAGFSAATVLAHVANVQVFLDRVLLWWEDPATYSPTVMEVQISNAASSVLYALLVPGEGQGIYPPDTYSDYAPMGWAENATIRLRHRQFLSQPLPKTNVPGPAPSGDRANITWPTLLDGINPLTLEWIIAEPAGTTGATVAKLGAGAFIYSSAASRLGVYNASSLSGTNYSSVADSANRARGTNVLRFTPPNTTTAYQTNTTLLSLATMTRVNVWATMRTTSPNTAYLVRAFTDGRGRRNYGPTTVVEFTDAFPHVVNLGPITNAIVHESVGLEIRAFTSTATIDIDTIVVVGAMSRFEGAVTHAALDNLNSIIGGEVFSMNIEHRLLESPHPFVGLRASSLVQVALEYQGNASLVMTADRVSTLWLTTTDNYWRATKADGTLLTTTINGSRNAAYTVPV